jgi:transposase
VGRQQARAVLEEAELTPVARRAIAVGLAQIDVVNSMLAPIKTDIGRVARSQPGCQSPRTHYGIGPITSVAIWSEMGDTRRVSSSSDAVRHPASTSPCTPPTPSARKDGSPPRDGHLALGAVRGGHVGAKKASPDYEYFCALRERLSAQRAALAVARKLARWCHHNLREVDENA